MGIDIIAQVKIRIRYKHNHLRVCDERRKRLEKKERENE